MVDLGLENQRTFRPLPPAESVDWLPILERAAVHYWGDGQLPSCGKPSYAWVDDTASLHLYAEVDRQACLIRFNLKAWRDELRDYPPGLCIVLLHEMGHLYGHEHSEGGVMDPTLTPDWRALQPCRSSMRHILVRDGKRVRWAWQTMPGTG